MDDPEPEDSVSGPRGSATPCSDVQNRDHEEELMMSHALEGLPVWRSPSRSRCSAWGRRSDVPSQHRSQDDEDDLVDASISKRTRAHYSLADMSLDQLETFLQESDEEDYFQNVDDEEEYRKFLAAVQEKVGPDEQNNLEKGTEESESEDEDADFEVEIEEALESDVEDTLDGIGRKRKRARRPVTRGKRRKRDTSVQNKVLSAGRAKASLRPLKPYTGSVFVGERSRSIPAGSAKRFPHSSDCGFTAHQIGQLYCLMHEHVQLLLQVHAMCVLEPAMQQTAAETHRMLMELVEKREAVLSWKRSAFPDFCFRPPYIHSSVPENKPASLERLSSATPPVVWSKHSASSACVISSSDLHKPGVSAESLVPVDSNSASTGTVHSAPSDQLCGSDQASASLSPQVLPQILHSSSCEVVDSSTQANTSSLQKVSVDNSCGIESALSSSSALLEPLPPEWVPATSGPVRSLMDVASLALVRDFTATVDQIVQASRERLPSENQAPDHSRAPLFEVQLQQLSESPKWVSEQVKSHCSPPNPKRTMAAALAESTKKQAIAVVSKDIAAAMVRFSPLFNKNLFPHKAPPATTANRLLFTDAEDELLAMGLMTCNNDWKAIQERFLPSKSMHQIFVRQKNRSSARAPHNSIKAVRRLKLSPLTAEEVACIEEALKVYKYDWVKVCRSCTPYRDPVALPRQWRVAIGTQKPVVHNREKRLHDTRKRQGFAVASQIYPSMGKVMSELYEAGNSGEGELETTQLREGPSDSPSPCCGTLSTRTKPAGPVYSKSSTSPTQSLSKKDQTVQLAPGLPPLKLPPTVRVLSHSGATLLQASSVHCKAKASSEYSTNNFRLGRLAGQI